MGRKCQVVRRRQVWQISDGEIRFVCSWICLTHTSIWISSTFASLSIFMSMWAVHCSVSSQRMPSLDPHKLPDVFETWIIWLIWFGWWELTIQYLTECYTWDPTRIRHFFWICKADHDDNGKNYWWWSRIPSLLNVLTPQMKIQLSFTEVPWTKKSLVSKFWNVKL